MPRFRLLHIVAMSMLSFSSIFGSDFLSQAFTTCATTFYNCSLGNITNGCTSSFGHCLEDDVFVNPPLYPEACDLSQAAIENLGWTIGTCSLIVAASIVGPICLKVTAWGITKLNEAPEGTWKKKIGKGLLLMTKGRTAPPANDAEAAAAQQVTADQLVNPQIVVFLVCASVPINAGAIANNQQAQCESAEATAKAAFPQYYAKVGSFLKTAAFSNCTSTFFGCGALQAITETCINAYGTCLSENVFTAAPAYPEECFLRDSMFENVWWVVGISGAAIASTFIVPVILKLCAAGINACADAPDGTWKKRFGNILLVMFDTNRDGRVEARELLDPQLLVGVYSILIPLTMGTTYNTQAGHCNYALRVRRAAMAGQ